MTRRLVLITGASAGLGEAFARAYAKRGWDVALTARRKDRLEALAADIQDETQSDTLVLPQDLSEPGAVDTLLAALKERGRTVDGLVNNAGYGLTGSFFESDWSEEAAFLTVLFHAPIELVHKLLPGMAERNYGRIINVASLLGYTAGSGGLYGPMKAGLIKFSEAVHAEAEERSLNIHCTAVCPGLTQTEFHDANGTREQINESPEWMWMDAEPVVEAGIQAVTRGQPVCVPGGVNKGVAVLAKLLPEPLGRAAIKAQMRRLNRYR